MRAVDGRPRHLERHTARLDRTLTALGITGVDMAALGARVVELLTANELTEGEASVRLTVTRGVGRAPRPTRSAPTVIGHAGPLPAHLAARRAGVHLRTVSGLPRALPRWKSLSYLPSVLALGAVEPHEEPLLVDAGGRALECATANLFAWTGAALLTPPDRGDILPGVARGLLIEAAQRDGLPTICTDLPLGELGRMPLFVTNALLPIAPVATLDGSPVPPAAPEHLARFRQWLV